MGLVSTHQLSTFTTPVNGTSPIDANQVKGNDNSIKTSYNAHDADTTIHLQSGAVATRPAASTAGQTWLATDSGAVYLYLDNGSAWVEANYLRNTGGTVTGNVLVTGTLGVTGATTLSSTLTIGGVTYTFPASQGANQYLKTDGSGNLSWVTFLETLALTDLSDVTITSVASGQFLLYDGTVWVNGTNGSALTTLNASNLSSGTVNTARVAGSYTGITAVGTLTAGAISTGFTAIADTFLATISTASKVSNSATTATNANTASAIVARDASGNFSAGTITASLTGNISGTAPAGTLTGTTLASNVVTSSLTSHGTLVSGAVPASLVTAGTFGAGAYTFPGALAITGAFTGATTGAFTGLTVQPTTGTSYSLFTAVNTGGTLYIGLDNSAGNYLGTGGAYGTGIYRPAATTFAISRTTSVDLFISATGAATFSGDVTIAKATAATFNLNSTTTTSLSQISAHADTAYLLVEAFGSTFGGTTWGNVTGNNQAVIEAQVASSLCISTYSSTVPIILAPGRTAALTLAATGAATFSSTLGVTGAATFSGGVTLLSASPTLVIKDTNAAVVGGIYGTLEFRSSDGSMPASGVAGRIDTYDDGGVYGDRSAMRFYVNNSAALYKWLEVSSAGAATFSSTVQIGTVSTLAQNGNSIYASRNFEFNLTYSPAITNNKDMGFAYVDNTHLRVYMKGSDGVTRSVDLTVA